MAGAEARMGVAIDMGSVLSAQKVKIQETETMTDLEKDRKSVSADTRNIDRKSP